MSVRGREVFVVCMCARALARVERVKGEKRRNGEDGERKRGWKNGVGVKGDLREGTCFAIERVAVATAAVAGIIGNVISYTIRATDRGRITCARGRI